MSSASPPNRIAPRRTTRTGRAYLDVLSAEVRDLEIVREYADPGVCAANSRGPAPQKPLDLPHLGGVA